MAAPGTLPRSSLRRVTMRQAPQIENRREHVSQPHNVGHRLDVHRMDGKQESCHERESQGSELGEQEDYQSGGGPVEQHVQCMERRGVFTPKRPLETEEPGSHGPPQPHIAA